MAPQYERCGDIVWLCKREARIFAFKCLYCEHQTTVFRSFKEHLIAAHAEEMRKFDAKEESVETKTVCNTIDTALECQQEMHKQQASVEVEVQRKASQSLPAAIESELDLDAAWQAQFDASSSSSDSDSDSDSDVLNTVAGDMPEFWLQEQPVMVSLIEQLESARPLWDNTMLEYRNYKRRGELCDQIARQLNEQYQLQLKCQEIADYAKKLRAAYAQEQRRLQQQQGDVADAVAATPAAWYHQRLSFLANSVRQRRSSTRAAADDAAAAALPVPQLTHEQNIKFIELYRRSQRIWDMQDLSCRLRHARLAAKQQLLQLCRSELPQAQKLEPAQLQRYIKHLRKTYAQEKLRRLECERGGASYTPNIQCYQQLQFLDAHLAPFRCTECDQMLHSVDGYKMHCAQHNGRLPFICPVCQRGFARSDNCTIHLRRHTQDYQLECTECGKRFANTTDLHVHRRQHTGEKPYCCDVCGQRFATCSFFVRHRRRHQQRPKGKCHLCGKTFYEVSVLNDHIKGHLNVRDKQCDVCRKCFTSAKYLRQHKEIHAPHKRYVCKICSKGFAQYAGLSGHMKSHGTIVRGIPKAQPSPSPTDNDPGTFPDDLTQWDSLSESL
ncbi:zinc finger protein 82-like [Drosophila novamexicana]|uniref:zinc finger protein 82-like n=1 Tax=Drosophila novamexicana TaxID=47314 RepID=UPI0011E595BF|nr:zinc finger protein 82-like [Drosophila novamexicana]